MFYAHFVLAKKGPLSRIWLAAHWDKKLTKAHVYECNIESSVKDIMQPKVKMALRTSGHLLLGVVRIYSRKAKYLLADCNEAFVKIKMAFRPGMVDLPEDKREAAMNAITLPDVFHDFDTAMPELDDVDINAQFTLNQTRAEEITMREDYGNLTLSNGDDGFGDSMANSLQMEGPEMMRDASNNFGSLGEDAMDMGESSKLREDSIAPASLAGDSEALHHDDKLDAPIRDDGFGGVGLVQDILSGGLFEGGSLFDDPMPGGSGSVRVPPSERTGFEDDDFAGMPSPMHSDGSDGRPATPPGNDDEDKESLAGSSVMGAPSLNATPQHVSVPPSPAHSYRSAATLKDLTGVVGHDQTTLLHNEEESFALAPVEASALKGERRKRKRKLIVDEIKAITGEGMKAQLSDSADIVTTLDIAPPTKRLMHWKETGGVDELFNLPGRKIKARLIVLDYQGNLKNNNASPDELFVTLPSVHEREDDFQLENVGGHQDDAEFASPKKRAPKRKVPEEKKENAYQKRQEELAKQQEEFAVEQKRLREQAESESVSLPVPASPAGQEGSFQPWAESPYPGTPGFDPAQSFGQVGQAPFTPAHSGYEGAPSMGYPTPQHEPNFATPQHAPAYPPAADPSQQASFTEQWVNQVQTTPGLVSPPQPGLMSPSQQGRTSAASGGDWDDNGAQDGGFDNGDNDESYEEADYEQEQGEGQDMEEDETIEEFEDRVLNKRAAQLHRLMTRKFAERFSQMTVRNTRKQVAQKFHSLLVLQKMMAVDTSQDEDTQYGEISIKKGPSFEGAAKRL
jgi:cohesin complex subunit SCC1